MSRCFPFPPPGYEKKTSTDGANLLQKEKHKEKKHKKEKKDKEKREGKERREKDGSDGKHRDKKDRKEKHKEKKKDKEEKNKEKEKSSTSEEKRIAGRCETYNGENLNQKEREWDKDKSNMSNENKQVHGGDTLVRSSLLSGGHGNSKFVQELGRRIRDEEGIGSQLVEKLPSTEQKNIEKMDRAVVKDTGIMAGGKEKKEKRVDYRKIDGQGIRCDARSSNIAVDQNLAGIVQNRVEGMPRPLEKNIERSIGDKEKSKERDGDEKRGDKRKDKKSHGKDKDRDKEKKKEEKTKEKKKEKSENKSKDQDMFRNKNTNDLLRTQIAKTSHVADKGNKNTAIEGNLKKRKDFEANGFLQETDRPNKMPRLNSHSSTDNGRKLEPCQNSIIFTSDRQGPHNNIKVDNKERQVNGVVEAQPSPICSKNPSSAMMQSDQIAQASTKPPHRDLKYLSQVLSVPKLEEWSDFDEQEWLFSCKHPLSDKPKAGSAGVPESPRAWAEGVQIESADVFALPYVVPY